MSQPASKAVADPEWPGLAMPPPRATQTIMTNDYGQTIEILRLFWHSRNASFHLFRKATVTVEIAEKPLCPAGEARSALRTP